MMARKTRKQKADEYEKKYSHIPVDYKERLEWLYDTLHITEKDAYNIIERRRQIISSLEYHDVNIMLFEVPEGSPRPRFRLVNRSNLSNMAMANPNFVHVYSLTGHEDNAYMKRLVTEQEFQGLNQIICTPCNIDINAYLKTPSYYNRSDTILAEIGAIRPTTKPDWDNIEKKYSDMFNKNVWLDDTLVIDGSIHRYYSVLPRIEIRLKFLNLLYTKQQYESIINRADFDSSINLSYISK
jgi:Holliday junction resolvase RusA-like endonuclease